MKKFYILIVIVSILALLVDVESKWYKNGRSINILKKYAMFSMVGKNYPSGQIKTENLVDGWLAFGPYLPLKKGEYEVAIKLFLNNLKSDDNPSRIAGYCDVDIEGHPELGQHIDLAIKSFQNKNPYTVYLKLNVPDGLPKTQFRTFQYGGNEFIITGIKLYAKTFRLRYDFLKSNFLLYNLILLLVSIFILSPGYFWLKNKNGKKQKIIESDFSITEEKDNSVSFNYLIQFSIVALFSLLILNAYWFNKFHIPIVPIAEIITIGIELLLFYMIMKRFNLKINIKFNLVDTILFASVFGFIGYSLIRPALPTFMPINYSNDCVLHYNWLEYLYNNKKLTGSILESYPFGYHLITVMLSKFTGIPAVKMMHIVLVFAVTLSATIAYSIIVSIFNLKKDAKLMAILPVFTLFWVRGYYELGFNELFHAPMYFSYMFMISFLWALVEYDKHEKWFSYTALIVSGIATLYTYIFHLPILMLSFFIMVVLRNKLSYSSIKTIIKDLSIVLLPIVFLALMHAFTGSTTKMGMDVLSSNGWCVPFRFLDFGDFGGNKIGGKFLILSLIGIPILMTSFRKKLGLNSFIIGFLFYLSVFIVLVKFVGKLSPYPISKLLYFSPYLGVICIAGVLYLVRKLYITALSDIIGDKIYKVLFVLWVVLIAWFGKYIYNLESYKPFHVELFKEPVFLTTDWARKNIKEKFDFIYHHPNIGNWMHQGFMGEAFNDAYYYKVFVKPMVTLSDWLNSAKKGSIAVVDDLNTPPLTDRQKKQFEIIYQKENSAVIKKIRK